jgi:hypothetical protein
MHTPALRPSRLRAEAQPRRVDGVLHGNQLFLRPGLGHKLNDHFTFILACAKVQNCSFDAFSFRKRIRVQAEVPLHGKYYFPAHADRACNHNWIYGAIGHNLGKKGRLELGYLYQHQHIHDFQIANFSKLPFL